MTYRKKALYQIRGSQLSEGRAWQDHEIELVRRLAGTMKTKLIAQKVSRSYESLRQMCKREKISLIYKQQKASPGYFENVADTSKGIAPMIWQFLISVYSPDDELARLRYEVRLSRRELLQRDSFNNKDRLQNNRHLTAMLRNQAGKNKHP